MSDLKRAKDEALRATHAMARVRAPLPAYVEALEELIEEVDMILTAAREDMEREEDK